MLQFIGLLVVLFVGFVFLKMIRVKIDLEYAYKVRKRIFESDPTEANQWNMWESKRKLDAKRQNCH